MRTVIYARYSSQLQNSRSIDDQIRVCLERCEAEGWEVVQHFTDYAISGAAGIREGQRPGLNDLLARVDRGDIQQVLCDTTSRIARHQGDSHYIRERINYAGARLFTLADGEIDPFKGGIKGLLDEQQRREMAHNIKRSQKGVVAEGRSPAGLAYGYRKANRLDERGNLIRGLRAIDEAQAEIVLRIFTEYAADVSPRLIASRLNEERIPAPRGATWRASTISGDQKRKNGMLSNRLYIGEIVHNRTSKLLNPDRLTRIRPNDESEWIAQSVPELRIIPQALWDKVQARRAARTHIKLTYQRRPKHLLSGIIFCGVCGGGWTVFGNDYWGCGRARDGGGCSNTRKIKRERMEARVIEHLAEKLLDPGYVADYVAEYHRDYARREAEHRKTRTRLERQAKDAAAKIDRLVTAIANGADVEEVRAALMKAREERAAVEDDLAQLEALPVVALHPTVAQDYREQVRELTAALEGLPEARMEAIPKLRGLIESARVYPTDAPRGVTIETTGRLTKMLELATGIAQPGGDANFTVSVERVKGIGLYRTFPRHQS